MASRLIFYSTSNYLNFPIGGELTSITNFLRYLAIEQKELCKNVVLVGATTEAEKIGQWQEVDIAGQKFLMLPVAVAERELSNVKRSLRAQFMKGIIKYGRLLKINKRDCNYVHTAEAYGAIKVLNPRATCVIFSHGSYFNMERGFRFYRKNIVVKKGFMLYVRWILRNAKMIFVLDDDSEMAYHSYNKNVVRAMNSIVCSDTKKSHGENKTLIFVGRLSKDKNIIPIMDAVNRMLDKKLLILGDGEEYEKLCQYESDKIIFVGAVPPAEVNGYLEQADILVMNSVFEGVPMTILEALSIGLPVVSTPVGGIPSVLSFGLDSEDTDGSAEMIYEKVQKIYAYYGKYAQAAYDSSKKFDYRNVNQAILAHLQKYWK